MFSRAEMAKRMVMLRSSAGMTQGEIQRRSHVSRSYISRFEAGQIIPGLGTLEKIAEALGSSVRMFVAEESDASVLLVDPFIREVAPLVKNLTAERREAIINQMQSFGKP